MYDSDAKLIYRALDYSFQRWLNDTFTQTGFFLFSWAWLECSTRQWEILWKLNMKQIKRHVGLYNWASCGLMVRESDSLSKGCEFESWTGRNCRWGELMYSALSSHPQYHNLAALEQGTAPRVLQHKWLPTALCVCVCVCVQHKWLPTALCVCVRACAHPLDWSTYRAQIPSMGHFTFFYVGRATAQTLDISMMLWSILSQTNLIQEQSLIGLK